jgi:hypothetical protein
LLSNLITGYVADQEIDTKFHKLIEMGFSGCAGIESPPDKMTFDAEHTISNDIKETMK